MSNCRVFSVRVVAAGAALVVAGGVLAPASSATAATWSVVTTPNPAAYNNRLVGVDLRTSTSGWAVGSADTRALVARWNGSSWSSTSALTQATALNGVDSSAYDNVWAVGAAGANPLTGRWNGGSWTAVPSPSPAGATDATLRAVKVFSTSNAWAVGDAAVGFQRRTHIVRWNGSAWSIMASPSPDQTQNLLVAVDGTANDLWAVGNLGHDGYGGDTVAGLVLRWNGTSWTRAAIPGSDSTFSTVKLHDLVVLGSNNVMVVGSAFHRGLLQHVPYVLRWNGSGWQHSTIPSPPTGEFHGVAAVSPTAVYAVGHKGGSGTFVARWNGSAWSQESTPSAGSSNYLMDAAATGTGTILAVGTKYDSNWVGRTLSLRGS
jgi:hypothetical protein